MPSLYVVPMIYTHNIYFYINKLVKKNRLGGELEKKGPNFFFGYGEKTTNKNCWPAAKNVARPKSRVAQNGYFEPNVAPAQQRNS